jgi:hypothetical protein
MIAVFSDVIASDWKERGNLWDCFVAEAPRNDESDARCAGALESSA